MKFSLKDITIAYQKAKADAWLRHDLNEDLYFWYEQDFLAQAKEFQKFMTAGVRKTGFTADWVGGWRLMAKKPKMRPCSDDEDMSIFSDPNENFKLSNLDGVAYRLMATPSVNFQILSSLWILKVGWKYDKRLLRNVYGNRLRPVKKGAKGPNAATRGSFKFYRPMFAKWKRDGINALSSVLKNHKAVVVTADAKAFFHSLKPDFLLDNKYLTRNRIVLTEEDRELTRLLVEAITVWARATPLKTGLPVGLAASNVIANVALLDFDKAFEGLPGRIFYGRYVDDILLVFRDLDGVRTRSDVWNKIALSGQCFNPRIEKPKNASGQVATVGIEFHPDYLESISETGIVFTGEKCRAFFLDTKTGPSFVETLEEQIRDVTSEFRYLPKNIFNDDDIDSKIQKLLTRDGEEADNFRKIDLLALRKKDLKELLREMRFLLRTLPPESWRRQRISFYRLVNKHLLTPPIVIEYAERDFSQIVSMAVLCGDFAELENFLKGIFRVCVSLCKKSSFVAGWNEQLVGRECVEKRWFAELFRIYARSIATSFRATANEEYNVAYKEFVAKCQECFQEKLLSVVRSQMMVRQYVLHDLAAHSFVEHLYRRDVRPLTCQTDEWACSTYGFADLRKGMRDCFDDSFVNAVERLGGHAAWPVDISKANIPLALLFPTRPISERDVAWLRGWRPVDDVVGLLNALRGYSPKIVASTTLSTRVGGMLEVKEVKNTGVINPIIALLNIKTDERFCCCEIDHVDADVLYQRLREIVDAVNVVIAQSIHVDYLVLHELAMPLRWFAAIAGHCADYNISMIAGTVYNVTDEKKKLCKNEVWMSLVRNENGFKQPEFVNEEKLAFARKEEYELMKEFGYSRDSRIPACNHAVIHHGAFAFSTLICSELTNIRARSRLRGAIDALFVLAWNKDIHGFSSIIESAAMDLHAYIIHANNNLYGDNRIRSPEKDEWRRDVVRLKGGEGVFCVVGKLDVMELRKFQQNWDPNDYYSPNPKKGCRFKPIPIEYEYDVTNFRREIVEEEKK